ncbi:ABC-three component system middle component 7 [Pseudomonas extremaustralis]
MDTPSLRIRVGRSLGNHRILLHSKLRDLRMITPNKFISFAESSLGHADKVYAAVEQPISLGELYKKTSTSIGSIELFLYAIEILHLSNALHVNLTTGIVSRC